MFSVLSLCASIIILSFYYIIIISLYYWSVVVCWGRGLPSRRRGTPGTSRDLDVATRMPRLGCRDSDVATRMSRLGCRDAPAVPQRVRPPPLARLGCRGSDAPAACRPAGGAGGGRRHPGIREEATRIARRGGCDSDRGSR